MVWNTPSRLQDTQTNPHYPLPLPIFFHLFCLFIRGPIIARLLLYHAVLPLITLSVCKYVFWVITHLLHVYSTQLFASHLLCPCSKTFGLALFIYLVNTVKQRFIEIKIVTVGLWKSLWYDLLGGIPGNKLLAAKLEFSLYCILFYNCGWCKK